MSQNPTIPPILKRPQPKPAKIPPVVEKVEIRKSYPLNPYAGIRIPPDKPVEPPIRQPMPSDADLYVVRHDEQIRGLERRVDGLEDVTASMDTKLDSITDTLREEIQSRKLEKATKDEEKVNEDQKTKRFMAFMAAIPIIISPIIGMFTSYMTKEQPKLQDTVVVVAEYNKQVQDCLEKSHGEQAYVTCVREAQLKNTPAFNR